MRRALLFLFFAVLLQSQGGSASGEIFEDVDLYISGDPEGELGIDEPSTSNIESILIASNEQGQGAFQELGRWTTDPLYTQSNISGDWLGKAWVSSNRDAIITFRYTLIQDEVNLNQFEFEGSVGAGEAVAISGESDFSLTEIDDSPLTLLVESSWTAQPGSPPPTPPENTTIHFEYGADSRDTLVIIPISHVQTSLGSPPNHNSGQSQVTVYLNVFDVFGVDDVLSMSKGDYNMRMGPVGGESPWESTVDKVTDRGDYAEIQFIWSYEGHTLPAGDNDYSIEFGATDLYSDVEWAFNLKVSIYIEPKPNVEVDSVTSTSKTAEFGKSAIYTISVQNTGSGSDEFIVTYDNNDGWTVDIDLYDLELEAGDSENIKVTVTPPDTASDGQESPTEITVTAASDSDIYDTITIITTAEEPEPKWDFSLDVKEEDNENYDFSCGCFIIRDRAEISIIITLTNEGNQQNNFNLDAVTDDSSEAFVLTFDPSFVSSLQPGQSVDLELSVKPRDDYFGKSTYLLAEAVSSGDGKTEESEPISIILEQSGVIDTSQSSKLTAPQGGTIIHSFQISNINSDPISIYFRVSGFTSDDQLAEEWFSFEDKDGKRISSSSPKPMFPTQSIEVTLRIQLPSNAVIGSYNVQIWMYNSQGQRISDTFELGFVATEAAEETDSNLLLYGGLFVVLASVLAYGYRNFYLDDGFEDEDEEFDELEDIPELIQPPVEPEAPVVPPPSPPTPAPAAVEAVVPVAETAPEPRKKWFGLFGKGKPEAPPVDPNLSAQTVAAEPVVAQPVAAEPVAVQPLAAEPVVAQPVAAEPVAVQPVAAEPVVAQPLAAEPVVAQPVVVQPVEEEEDK